MIVESAMAVLLLVAVAAFFLYDRYISQRKTISESVAQVDKVDGDRGDFYSTVDRKTSPGRAKRASPHHIVATGKRPVETIRTLADILETVDGAFECYRLPTMRDSWLSKQSQIGLRKLGAHIPDQWQLKSDLESGSLPPVNEIPTLMMIGLGRAEKDENFFRPAFVFSVKHERLPWNVSRNPGVPFQFGYAFRVDERRGSNNDRLWWSYFWLTVDGDRIHICDDLRQEKVVVKGSLAYSRKKWGAPILVSSDEFHSEQQRKKFACLMFANTARWWHGRDTRWNVVVKKSAERVTFSVSPDKTRYFFADRDKSARARDGSAKKIIHIARAHQRQVGNRTVNVREHIRGLREFDWRGYHILVTCPKFTAPTAAAFTPAAYEGEIEDPSGVDISRVGKLLAELEERDMRSGQFQNHLPIDGGKEIHA